MRGWLRWGSGTVAAKVGYAGSEWADNHLHPPETEPVPVSIIGSRNRSLTMKTLAALGASGGFFIAARGWVSLALVVWIAGRVSRQLALAVFKEALRAGWYDAAR